jgi:hypothetical protein
MSATFTVTTAVVAATTDVTITAALAGVTRTATLRVIAVSAPIASPGPPASLAFDADDLIGGTDTRGTVALSSPAPSGGVSIRFSTSDSAVTIQPSTLTIAHGQTSGEFEVKTTPVTGEMSVTITAQWIAPGIRTASSVSFLLRLRPAPPPPPPPSANRAPVANDESYSVARNTQLLINAPGVLANDTDPDGDALTAELVQGPSNGGMSLGANGAFSYTPFTNFSGTDTFRYRARDAQTTSNTVTATITVGQVIREETFLYTGGVQEFTVPAGTTSLSIEAYGGWGASGLTVDGVAANPGGIGAMVVTNLAVSPGEVLRIIVGGDGHLSPAGGFNGGGARGLGAGPRCGAIKGGNGGAGGGATEIRRAPFGLGDRLVVAGGGGGGSGDSAGGLGSNGGDGFGPSGDFGSGAPGANGGGPGTQSGPGAGGSGGSASADGTAGTGITGGEGGSQTCISATNGAGGGGGGGGYFGAGGGEAGAPVISSSREGNGGGGGGGSAFPPSAEHYKGRTGPGNRSGAVIIRYCVSNCSTAGVIR